ncbi:hypothetical protein AWW66_23675 [Micromonospora rosaria]|uniref:Uncharacterized protein n=1 Tax=Micromonospora rosaria TaxID=47874 RepID=A0A136PMC9_9ACTN|nr:hypothetical protein AWW66_23675 [Micromonospora rosaria]
MPTVGTAMTDARTAEQIRILHLDTTTAIEQRRTLAAEARAALLAALHDRLICRPGCEDALATWGLEPLPDRWTISAQAQLSYTRSHTDHDEAREQARWGVPDELRWMDPPVAVYPRQVIDVTPAPAGPDQSGPPRFDITVEVTFRTWVTATRAADAYEAARTATQAQLPALAAVGVTLTGLVWQNPDCPDTAPVNDIDTGPQTVAGAAQETDADDLAVATSARDAAVQALAGLRRSIRARAIRALVDDEFGGIFQHHAQRVDRFLVGLGLDPLPRAHPVTVIADLTLPAGDGTVQDACDAARATMRAVVTSSPDETRPWTAYGWVVPEQATCDQDGWRVPWQHEYQMLLRGHATAADAGAAAEALVRADLTRALAGIAHQLVTVTATVEPAGVDMYLDPDRD